MRYVLLFLLLVGCDEQLARGDDAPEKRETYTAAVQRYEASVASMSQTLGNNTSELEAVKNELKALRLTLDSLEGQVGDVHKLLTVDTEISLPVPGPPAEPTLAPPVKVDAPPKDADRHTAGVTLHGNPLNVAAAIKANYRRMWSYPGSIDSHLAEHGVAGFQGLDHETKRKLHSALHEMGSAPAKAVTKSRVVVKAPVVLPQSSSCPNGNCPNAAYGYSRSRSRLFGWRR